MARAEKITENGMELLAPMGVSTAINFQPTGDGKAAITGDFVLTGREVNPVAKSLRETEFRGWEQLSAAVPAADHEAGAALQTRLRLCQVLVPTRRTLHQSSSSGRCIGGTLSRVPAHSEKGSAARLSC